MSEASARHRAANAGRSWQIEDEETEKEDALIELRTRLVNDLQNNNIQAPPLPKVALELNELANSLEPDLRKARVLIERDPQLAGQIIKIASSPSYGGRAVGGIEIAISRLGTNGLRDIAMAMGMGRVFRCKELGPYIRSEMCHSFVVASTTRVVCGIVGIDKNAGFLCGLFHDIGRLTIGMAVAQYCKESETPLDQVVLEALADQHHEQVGSYVLGQWGLHTLFRHVAASHHNPSKAGGIAPMAFAVAAADVADRIDANDVAERAAKLSQMPQCAKAGLTSSKDIEKLAQAVEDARSDDVMSSLL